MPIVNAFALSNAARIESAAGIDRAGDPGLTIRAEPIGQTARR
jgi:hypothetical protein